MEYFDLSTWHTFHQFLQSNAATWTTLSYRRLFKTRSNPRDTFIHGDLRASTSYDTYRCLCLMMHGDRNE